MVVGTPRRSKSTHFESATRYALRTSPKARRNRPVRVNDQLWYRNEWPSSCRINPLSMFHEISSRRRRLPVTYRRSISMILGVRCVTPETPGRSSTRYFQSLRRPTTRSWRTRRSAWRMRSRPVASSPHQGQTSIQSLTPLLQWGQMFWNSRKCHFWGRPHQGQNRIGYITPPPHPQRQRRSYLNPFGALSGSGLDASSVMSRPHQEQNEKASETIQPQ